MGCEFNEGEALGSAIGVLGWVDVSDLSELSESNTDALLCGGE